jgi:ribosomal protein L28
MHKETAETLMEEKFSFRITEKTKRFFKEKEVTHEFSIPALNLFTMIRISNEVLTIDKKLLSGQLIDASMQLLSKHGNTIIKIIAYAVLNDNVTPGKDLLKRLSLLNAIELKNIVDNVLKQMNLVNLLRRSIISIAGINLMEMNPKEQGS